MDGGVTVRFSESESYDINTDTERVMYLGTTGKGSYYAFGPADKDKLRRRKEFQELVVELIQEGIDPTEVEFGDPD